jgi:hypothetical protein
LKLLDDIIEGVTDAKEPTANVLRKCLVLAYKLRNDTLKQWVEKELNGYDYREEMPAYRKSSGIARGLFLGGFGAELRDQPLPASILKAEHRHMANEIRLNQPIAAYEGGDLKTSAALPWPADFVALYQSSFIKGMTLNRAWMEIPPSMMVGLIDTVRTRILTFALEIQRELPDDTEKAVAEIPSAVVERLVNVTIMGGNNVIGNVNEFNAPTVVAGDVHSLGRALTAVGVSAEDIKQLEVALNQDKAEASEKPKAVGQKTLEWIGKAARQLGGGAARIGGSVAEEAIRAAVMKYLGL